jgi:hypothetical protein
MTGVLISEVSMRHEDTGRSRENGRNESEKMAQDRATGGNMFKRILLVLPVLCFCSMTELMAPETTERDVFGYESYRIEGNGVICDKGGVIKGWMHGNTVYDTQWNVRYHYEEADANETSSKGSRDTGQAVGVLH